MNDWSTVDDWMEDNAVCVWQEILSTLDHVRCCLPWRPSWIQTGYGIVFMCFSVLDTRYGIVFMCFCVLDTDRVWNCVYVLFCLGCRQGMELWSCAFLSWIQTGYGIVFMCFSVLDTDRVCNCVYVLFFLTLDCLSLLFPFLECTCTIVFHELHCLIWSHMVAPFSDCLTGMEVRCPTLIVRGLGMAHCHALWSEASDCCWPVKTALSDMVTHSCSALWLRQWQGRKASSLRVRDLRMAHCLTLWSQACDCCWPVYMLLLVFNTALQLLQIVMDIMPRRRRNGRRRKVILYLSMYKHRFVS